MANDLSLFKWGVVHLIRQAMRGVKNATYRNSPISRTGVIWSFPYPALVWAIWYYVGPKSGREVRKVTPPQSVAGDKSIWLPRQDTAPWYVMHSKVRFLATATLTFPIRIFEAIFLNPEGVLRGWCGILGHVNASFVGVVHATGC
jgi:hypothetical protein